MGRGARPPYISEVHPPCLPHQLRYTNVVIRFAHVALDLVDRLTVFGLQHDLLLKCLASSNLVIMSHKTLAQDVVVYVLMS
jgi:hypothetical protein